MTEGKQAKVNMKENMGCLLAVVTIAAIISATSLAVAGVRGWEWFVVIAVCATAGMIILSLSSNEIEDKETEEG